jgi:NADP-reducing hydrogenase subunit HndC
MTPEQVIEEMKKSGLRGRGGAGFPTGVKWGLPPNTSPTSNMSSVTPTKATRCVHGPRHSRRRPAQRLEAMAIGGYAIGGTKGTIYIRAEYPLAIKRLIIAIEQAKEMGLLGQNIFGSDFSFDIDLKYGAGAFVCGEETALINSMEGNRGEPYTKPPFPAEAGYWDKPTIVNNVETLAAIPAILVKGPTGSTRSVPRPPRAPRCSPWPARSTTSV